MFCLRRKNPRCDAVCSHVLLTGCSFLNKAGSILYCGGNAEEKLVLASNLEFVTRGKMQCLRDGVWLNDEVINFYISMLQQRNDDACNSAPSEAPACKIFNTFLHSKVCGTMIRVVCRTQHHWPPCSS